MSDRTPPTLATPLGRMVDAATPSTSKPLVDPARSRSARSRGKLNLKAVAEVLAERGLDPTVEIVKVLQANQLDPDVRARVLLSLMEYVHAKKKSVEITGADGGPVQIENVPDQTLIQIAMGNIVPSEGDDLTPLPLEEN